MAPSSGLLQIQMDNQCSIVADEKLTKSLRQRRTINYSQFDYSSEEESDSELFEQDAPLISCLPRGIVRGCIKCENCQKVTARWRPEDARRPVLDEAPVFYPNEEEFKDTLKYITSIRPKAEPYGICRIVPPSSWNPPCPLKEKIAWENSTFSTRIQQLDKLQNRLSVRKLSRYQSIMKRKRRKVLKMGVECKNSDELNVDYHNNTERFGFEPGPVFTLESFQKYAEDFREQYFRAEETVTDLRSVQDEHHRQCEPSVENIEGEYWRMVEKPTEEVEVLYGADLETGVVGSGFPKITSALTDSDLEEKYVKSGWNLNNLARLSGSLLAFESGDISGVMVPWLYIGMCFSSFCWHVEDHYLYSLNYMHWGAPKMWYGVPGSDALKLEAAMKKHLPDLFEGQPDLLYNLVTQFSPSTLKSEGVPVFRCVQNPGEFVLTFPRAYHAGFNCGFNCAEAVNVAPIDWLPHGQFAVELYRDQGRKISVSHDKLLLGAARAAVRAQWNILFLGKNTVDNLQWKDACGVDGVLAKALKARIDTEHLRREHLCCSSQSRKMDAGFDANGDRECLICHYDLHLSAVCCSCSPDRFVCLNHAKKLCSCAWSMRFFLFRYEISDLNILLDALGGKLSAVHRWGLSDLGLSLSSCVSKDKVQKSESVCRKSTEGTNLKEQGPLNGESPAGVARNSSLSQDNKSTMPEGSCLEKSIEKDKGTLNVIALTHTTVDPSLLFSNGERFIQKGIQREAVGTEEPCLPGRPLSNIGGEDQTFQVKKGSISSNAGSLSLAGHQFSQEARSCHESSEQNSLGQTTSFPKAKHLSKSYKADNLLPAGADDVIISEYGEFKESCEFSCKIKEESIPQISDGLLCCCDMVTPCNYHKYQVLETPVSNASVETGEDINSTTMVEKVGHISNPDVRVRDQGKDETTNKHQSLLPEQSSARIFSQSISSSKNTASVHAGKLIQDFLAFKQEGKCNISHNGSKFQHLQVHGTVKPNEEIKDGKTILDVVPKLMDRGQSINGSPSCPSNSIDRYNRSKGPRMAKVVRRINSIVEPLAYGVVLSGRLWSTSQAIFPKGYRSRVKYFSVLDPAHMCYYVSEILDAGLSGPLFMVLVEQCPSEVFINASATKCWDMVRERVNQEIGRQHSLGKTSIPTLQPPGSLDGLEMFGLSSPSIIQAIEAIDIKRVCSEYWTSKAQIQDSRVPVVLTGDRGPIINEEHSVDDPSMLLRANATTFWGLLKKADPEELRLLHGILGSDGPIFKEEAIRLLNKEIENHLKSDSPALPE